MATPRCRCRLAARFIAGGLRLVSSQVGHVAPSHRARWTHHRRLADAVALLADARLDALLAPAMPFPDLPARLPDILDPKSGYSASSFDRTA